MDLFDNKADEEKNLLPFDGTVLYLGKIFSASESNFYLDKLLNSLAWKNDEAILFGKKIVTKRKVAWYADQHFEYRYSNITRRALLWTKELLILKDIAETKSAETYNSCLLNLYHNGEEGMAWHSDAEKDLKPNGAIASISFGAGRKFSFKHKKSGQVISLMLEPGSMLIMKDTTQTHWLHRLPPATKILKPRINLTFRSIVI